MSKLIAKQLLLTNNYWVLNKNMVQLLGLEGAFLLSSFAEAENMMADKEGWFYQTSDTVEKITTLSRHKQDQAIKKMRDIGILEQDNRGVPPKRYFKINYECLTNQFANILQIEVSKIDKLNCKKSATNKESINKESNYKESIKQYSASNDTPHTFIKDIKKAEKEAYKIHKDILINEHFERMWTLYPDKRGKGRLSVKKKKTIYELNSEFERCIDRYLKDIEIERLKFPEKRFQMGSTFFNSGYVDYLDENYKEMKESGNIRGDSQKDEYSGLGWSFEDMQGM